MSGFPDTGGACGGPNTKRQTPNEDGSRAALSVCSVVKIAANPIIRVLAETRARP
jgi:hypothetical protein